MESQGWGGGRTFSCRTFDLLLKWQRVDSPGEGWEESPGWSKMKAELGVRACQRHWLITKTGLCFSHLKQQGMVKGGGHKNPVTGEDNRRHWFFGCCWFAFLSFVLLSMGFVFIWRRQRKTLQNYFELNNDVKIHKAGFEQQHSDRELWHLPALKSKQQYS